MTRKRKQKKYRANLNGVFSNLEEVADDNKEGQSFADAKRRLSKHLRSQRDAYSMQYRDVRRMKEEDL